ncbi:MAG: shikimate kinase, partial [Clostridia bacterium]|nr:shikimate kinase [Clostridia bacterium]
MNVVLIGMPGSGKSRLGKALAAKTGLKFFDTDALVREKYGDISDIFAKYGEDFFRRKETAAAIVAAANDGAVIATGGGIVVRPENMEILKKNALVIYLEASVATLVGRTRKRQSRPLLSGG